MKKPSPNAPCPCGSGIKYKKCCARYHKGALAPDALTLMKSRYSAYALGDAKYIVKTTHPDNSDYSEEKKVWERSISEFCQNTDFLGLKIIAFTDGTDEAYVTFEANLSSGLLHEKSRFLKVDGRWLYINALFNP